MTSPWGQFGHFWKKLVRGAGVMGAVLGEEVSSLQSTPLPPTHTHTHTHTTHTHTHTHTPHTPPPVPEDAGFREARNKRGGRNVLKK